MTAAAATEPLSGITTGLAGDTEPAPTAKQWAIRYLMVECGLTGSQARRMFEAYQRDLADEARIGNDTGRSDAAFLEWLLKQTPGGRKPRKTPKREWRVSS